jgi:predicted N-formylglutamate amidohydrolase
MILTPFFLDEPLPELENLAAPDWIINQPDLPDGDIQQRLSAIHRPLADLARQAIEAGNRTDKIAAVSVSSWNPKMDEDDQSRNVCMGLLTTLIND